MHRKTLTELKDELDGGHCSSEELVHHFLERIERLDPRLNCFITTTPDAALEAARAADRRPREGHGPPLSGLPIAHKDIFCTRDLATTCGSRMLANFIAPYDATCVAQLGAAGAITLGKTNMDEFAMGSSTETSYYGPTRNPWDLDAVPGGSSGGSAAAVAAGLVPAATGTDTGGSIRQPASLCGVTGLKPTYGRVSRYGMIAFASSLDQGGAFGRSAADVALILEGMAAFDPRDSTSVDTPVPAYSQALSGDIRGLRVGVPREYLAEGLDDRVAAAVHAAVEAIEAQGAEVREVSLPHTAYSVPTYYVLASAECSSNLSRYDGVRFGYRCDEPRDLMDLYKRSRGEGFGAEVQRRIMVGTYTLSSGYYEAYYAKAQRMRRLIQRDFIDAFESVDVLACPVSPTPAFNLGEKLDDPVTMYLSDVFTIAVNLAGLPALSAPAGFVDGRPVGLQLIGNYFDEARILNAAHAYQQATDWHRLLPEAFA